MLLHGDASELQYLFLFFLVVCKWWRESTVFDAKSKLESPTLIFLRKTVQIFPFYLINALTFSPIGYDVYDIVQHFYK